MERAALLRKEKAVQLQAAPPLIISTGRFPVTADTLPLRDGLATALARFLVQLAPHLIICDLQAYRRS
jgi:hypothetical protein